MTQRAGSPAVVICSPKRLLTLRRAISKLPEPYRVAVTLVELQGLSCEEAAAVMGTPKGTVLSRLFRARERLRRLLLSEFGRSRTLVPASAQNS